MNNINNTYNEKEVKNKLKDFEIGKDYSVHREGKKIVYDFTSEMLKAALSGLKNYTTVYEAVEEWDTDNYNHRREAGEWVGKNDGRVTYRYEHNINKDGSYHAGWEKEEEFEFGDNWSRTRARVRPVDNNFFTPFDEAENHRRNLENFRNERAMLERDIENLSRYSDHEAKQKIVKFRKRISELNEKIAYHQDWLDKNTNTNNSISCQPEWVKCGVCGKTFNKSAEVWGVQDEVGFLPCCCYDCAEKYANKKGGRVIKSGPDEYFRRDEKDRKDNYNLEKENKELRQELAQVKEQLAAILEELKILRNNSVGQNNSELDQQIARNEKLIKDGKKVSEAELKEQLQKSEALLKGSNSEKIVPSKDNSGSGSLPYVIGGSVILAAIGIVSYYLVKRNKKNKRV